MYFNHTKRLLSNEIIYFSSTVTSSQTLELITVFKIQEDTAQVIICASTAPHCYHCNGSPVLDLCSAYQVTALFGFGIYKKDI